MLPEANFIVASTLFYYEYDVAAAEKEYRRHIELNPNSPDAHGRLGLLLASVGRFDEAVEAGNRAIELDPLSPLVNYYAGCVYWFANRQKQATAQARKAIELAPEFFAAHWLLGAIYKSQGEYEKAVEPLQKAVEFGGNQTALSTLGDVFGLMEKTGEAREILDQLLEMRGRQYVSAYDIARVYEGLGAADETFEWLEKAFEERNGELIYLEAETKVGAGFVWHRAIREDARLLEFLQKIRVAPFAEKSNPAIDDRPLRAVADNPAVTKNPVQSAAPENYCFNGKAIAGDSEFVLEHHVFEQIMFEEIPDDLEEEKKYLPPTAAPVSRPFSSTPLLLFSNPACSAGCRFHRLAVAANDCAGEFAGN